MPVMLVVIEEFKVKSKAKGKDKRVVIASVSATSCCIAWLMRVR
jgi:hypothetical protein